MNRFEYIEARLQENEAFVSKESQIKLYDGDQKVRIKNKYKITYVHIHAYIHVHTYICM